jgi:hypothetical protein
MNNPLYQVIASGDGTRVWVNGPDGSAIGRFNKHFGIDVHTTATAQKNGAPECLYCTHGKATAEDWETFREKMKTHHDVDVPADLITWEDQKNEAIQNQTDASPN